LSRWDDLLNEEFAFEIVDEEVTKMNSPMDRMKYAMQCKPMVSKEATEAYLKIASMCKAFDEMPMPMQNYVAEVEEEFGFQPPESVV
jgi:adenylosuccinate synthase